MRHSPPPPIEHLFTIDVEEYFQVNAFEGIVRRDDWGRHASRVEGAVERLLALLERRGMQGTFFTLGWIAKAHPQVVRRIAEAGHEIASHGWWHHRVPTLTPEAFRDDVRNSRRILEDVSGQHVEGFRAPSFSIIPGYEWAFDVLVEEGYRYDSSVFPIRRHGYGWPSAPSAPYRIACPAGDLLELPMTTLAVGGMRLPAAGGGWFRQFPYGVVSAAFHQCEREGRPGVFYLHPWEIDPEQPRLPVSWVTRQRHYRGLGETFARLERLLHEHRFTSVRRACARGDITPVDAVAA
jgi:polysaccharide deacetylase family protein (PEP-CTERM system associated)